MTGRFDGRAQRMSRSYLLPFEDTEFLMRDEMRAIRFALEYGKAELLSRDWSIQSTVIVLAPGSHRLGTPKSILSAPAGQQQ